MKVESLLSALNGLESIKGELLFSGEYKAGELSALIALSSGADVAASWITGIIGLLSVSEIRASCWLGGDLHSAITSSKAKEIKERLESKRLTV